MGIKNFGSYIRKHYPNVFQQQNLSDFSYQKCAIDIASYIYKWKVGLGEKWIVGFIQFLVNLKKYNIHAIIVLDGKRPEEKHEEQNRRRNAKEITLQNVVDVRVHLERYKTDKVLTDVLKETHVKIERQKHKDSKKTNEVSFLIDSFKDLKLNDDKFDIETVDYSTFSVPEVMLWLIKKESQNVSVSKDTLQDMRLLLDLLKIPYLDADFEAEAACCSICNDNKVEFVISCDSDCVAHCAKKWISSIDFQSDDCIVLEYQRLLDETGLSKEQMIDFCIGCGTDYNSNIKDIGNVKMMSLIKQYGTLEEISKQMTMQNPNIDCSVLKIESSRKNFVPQKIEIEVPFWDTNFDIKAIEQYLYEIGCSHQIDIVKHQWKTVEFDFDLND